MALLKSQEVSDLNGRLALRDDEIAKYKDAASGADPAQLKQVMDDLLQRVKALENRMLTDAQLQEIKGWLSKGPSNVTVSYDPLEGDKYAKLIKDAFSDSGWNAITSADTLAGNDSKRTPVVLSYADPASTPLIENALKAGGLRYEVHPDVGDNKVQQIWLDAIKQPSP